MTAEQLNAVAWQHLTAGRRRLCAEAFAFADRLRAGLTLDPIATQRAEQMVRAAAGPVLKPKGRR